MALPDNGRSADAHAEGLIAAVDDLVAIDLTVAGHQRGLWLSGAAAPESGSKPPSGLPADGFVSPWGFLFYPAISVTDGQQAFRVSVQDPSSRRRRNTKSVHRGRVGGPPRIVEVDKVIPTDENMTIVIDGDQVEVFVSPTTWRQVSEGILFAVAQYFRYTRTEQAFVELQHQARHDYGHATSAGVASLHQRWRLAGQATAVRHAVSDWVYFEGPGSDPWNSCSTEVSAELASALAADLDIDGRAQRIDEVVEDVENTYEVISDKLFHYRLFMWGIILEAVIIALLIGLIFR